MGTVQLVIQLPLDFPLSLAYITFLISHEYNKFYKYPLYQPDMVDIL